MNFLSENINNNLIKNFEDKELLVRYVMNNGKCNEKLYEGGKIGEVLRKTYKIKLDIFDAIDPKKHKKNHDKKSCKFFLKKIEIDDDYHKKDDQISYIKQEIKVLKRLSDNKFCLCYFFDIKINDKYYIATEFLTNYRDLFYIETQRFFYCNDRYKYLDFRRLIINMIDGLKSVHSLGIVHRDIKPENIMFENNEFNIKYVDFGFSCYISESNPIGKPENQKAVGTDDFIDFEHVFTDGRTDPFTYEDFVYSDIYALGVTLIAIVYGKITIKKRKSMFNDFCEKISLKLDPDNFFGCLSERKLEY